MAKFKILIYDDQSFYINATPEAWRGVVEAHGKFREGVFELGGSLAGGEALAPAATTIKDGGTRAEGPIIETGQSLNGYYVIEARDLVHALAIAKLCPAPGGGVEVRAVVDPSTNPF
ncbi:hypothetical protein FBY40_0093 [Microbacterium sp. SLBN-154]|uniref:YciI family protein n=1 Tax=Microbacterium sp. SLBN-154 TaxID=2768458 RepID=UPI001150C298|nr:YciI family protein [Microbacterium sp. SLBN-154]TQK17616.1 hypothetical protein FBY40_0093 [Microbacterium sp. SLBN-154]